MAQKAKVETFNEAHEAARLARDLHEVGTFCANKAISLALLHLSDRAWRLASSLGLPSILTTPSKTEKQINRAKK